MHFSSLIAAATVALLANAAPHARRDASDTNPFLGKNYYASSFYSGELNQTVAAFLAQNDALNAARTRTVQKVGSFVWITNVASIPNIAKVIAEARAEQSRTMKEQIVELVLYDIPDRDCSGGQSSGEFYSIKNGLNLYKTTFIDPFAAAVSKAPDLTFAIILEPDSLANVITNQNLAFCAGASSTYEEGIAYAIAKLQFPNVALYIDAAHGGWLGWDANLPLAAAEFAKVVGMARNITKGAKIRGFSTDVANFNAYIANPRANYTQNSNSYDESHYANSLAPFLTNASLPAHFIIDQERSGLQNARATWGEWCNVKAGYGIRPTTNTNNTNIDSIVWVKPGGESDGACGPTVDGVAAPSAGQWFEKYVEQMVKLADPPLDPSY